MLRYANRVYKNNKAGIIPALLIHRQSDTCLYYKKYNFPTVSIVCIRHLKGLLPYNLLQQIYEFYYSKKQILKIPYELNLLMALSILPSTMNSKASTALAIVFLRIVTSSFLKFDSTQFARS